jgi:acetoin utilization deacetylase AcuC-like enzyme
MKVIYSHSFYHVYTSDPAAAAGRIEAVINALPANTELIEAEPATEAQIALAHTTGHIESVRGKGLFEIAALAAGGAIQAARLGLEAPAFGAIRPPGHHASHETCWGFCYFNNMAVALLTLKDEGLIETAAILDFDLHYGDGNVNILDHRPWVNICNPGSHSRDRYLEEVESFIEARPADMIGISAGFDHHIEDWGGLLRTRDYHAMGRMVIDAARKNNGGCFAILEGGYNHDVIGRNAAALMEGLSSPFPKEPRSPASPPHGKASAETAGRKNGRSPR